MTDRELLELAAKAAGIELVWRNFSNVPNLFKGLSSDEIWNPLADDGDALRLACALRINIEHAKTLNRKAYGVNCWPVGRGDCGHMENDLADYPAATRRAIVRAAAEIGRSKE